MQINQEKIPWCQKTGGEIEWEFVESTGSVTVHSIYKVSAGEVIQISMWFWQYGADFFSSSCYQEAEISSDDITMTLFYSARPHTLFPVMSLITPSVRYTYTWRATAFFTSPMLSADHTHLLEHTNEDLSLQLQIILLSNTHMHSCMHRCTHTHPWCVTVKPHVPSCRLQTATRTL